MSLVEYRIRETPPFEDAGSWSEWYVQGADDGPVCYADRRYEIEFRDAEGLVEGVTVEKLDVNTVLAETDPPEWVARESAEYP